MYINIFHKRLCGRQILHFLILYNAYVNVEWAIFKYCKNLRQKVRKYGTCSGCSFSTVIKWGFRARCFNFQLSLPSIEVPKVIAWQHWLIVKHSFESDKNCWYIYSICSRHGIYGFLFEKSGWRIIFGRVIFFLCKITMWGQTHSLQCWETKLKSQFCIDHYIQSTKEWADFLFCFSLGKSAMHSVSHVLSHTASSCRCTNDCIICLMWHIHPLFSTVGLLIEGRLSDQLQYK